MEAGGRVSPLLIGILLGAALAISMTALTLLALFTLARRTPDRGRCPSCGTDVCVLCGAADGRCCNAVRPVR